MIRKASIKDAEAIAAIYNMAIAVGFCTADTEPQTIEARRNQMEAHPDPSHCHFVFEEEGIIAGWASLSPHRPGRKALRFTKEVSFYIHPQYQSRGIGSQLLKHTIHFADKSGIKTLFALLLESNTKSIGLLRKFGFEKWGHLPGVADFEGTEVGQYIYGRRVK